MKQNHIKLAGILAYAMVCPMVMAAGVNFEGNSALSDEELNAVTVPLVMSGGVYKAAPKGASDRIAISDLNASKLSDEAIVTLLRSISEAYQARKIFAVQATVTGADYGRFKGGAPLRVQVRENKISEVRVVPANENEQLWEGTEDRVKGAIVVAPGDLVEMGRVEEGINLLNRHPRRYVEPYLRGEDGRLVLEYRVNQLNPYSGRFGFDTYGTNSGGELRFTGGFDFYNLLGTDDKLSGMAVAESNLDTWALALSYESALDHTGRLKGIVSGTMSSYDSSQLGLGSLSNDFSGDTYSFAGDLSYTLHESGGMFVDATAGLRWLNVTQDSSSVGVNPVESDFLLAGLGISASSLGRDQWWNVGVRVETNLPDIADTVDEADLVRLGRTGVSRDFTYASLTALYGRYIDEWFSTENRRAHEIQINAMAYASVFGDRLPPSFLFVAGGGDHVRGYPKALISGDYGFFLSTNYTVHLPRLLDFGGSDGFRMRPRFAGDHTDWDLALSFFVDAAYTEIASALPSEDNTSLFSTGVGLAYSYKDRFRANITLGVPLNEVESGLETIEAGDARIDMGVSFYW